jgi:hypothetical protein
MKLSEIFEEELQIGTLLLDSEGKERTILDKWYFKTGAKYVLTIPNDKNHNEWLTLEELNNLKFRLK